MSRLSAWRHGVAARGPARSIIAKTAIGTAVHHCRLRGLRRYSPPGGRNCQAPCLSLLRKVLLYHAMVADGVDSRLSSATRPGVLAGCRLRRCSRRGSRIWNRRHQNGSR